MKLIYPDENITREQAQEILEYALVGRRRVKEQLKKIGGMEFSMSISPTLTMRT